MQQQQELQELMVAASNCPTQAPPPNGLCSYSEMYSELVTSWDDHGSHMEQSNSSVETGWKNHGDPGPNFDLGRHGDKATCQHIINTSNPDTVPRCFQ